MARLSCSQAANAGSQTPKPHPSTVPWRALVVGPGQGESKWRGGPGHSALLPPLPPPLKSQGHLQNSPHTLCRRKGPTSLPRVSRSDIKAQAPGPSGLLKLQGPGQPRPQRGTPTPNAHTHQHAPRQAESLPELVKRTSPFKTNRTTQNHNTCSEQLQKVKQGC